MRDRVNNTTLGYKQNIVRCNEGFRFSIICALFWGLAYYIINVLMHHEYDSFSALIIVSIFLSAGISLLVMVLSVFWVAIQGKSKELRRTWRVFSIYKYYIAAAVVGGIAATSTYITLGMVDSIFSTVSVLFYPVIGSMTARYWYREKMTKKCAAGIIVILLFSLLLYLPYFIRLGEAHIKECLFGIVAGVGWGLEAVLVGRAQDFTDSDVGLAIRYFWETLFWIIILLVMKMSSWSIVIGDSLKEFYLEPKSMLLILVCAFCLTFNYINWYKGFVYIGVSRGTAISVVSGFVILVLSIALERSMPDWYSILTAAGSLLGVYIIYNDCVDGDGLPVLRELSQGKRVIIHKTKAGKMKSENIYYMAIKLQIIHLVAENKVMWDYEIADMLEEIHMNPMYFRRKNFRNKIRQWTIEMRTAGLIWMVEEGFDIGDKFQKGKRLCRYEVTPFGFERIRGVGIQMTEPTNASQCSTRLH